MTNSNVMKRVALGATVLLVVAIGMGSKTPVYTGTLTISNYNGATPYTLQSDGNGSASYSVEFVDNGSGTYYQLNLDPVPTSRSILLTLTPVNGSPAGPFAGPVALSGSTPNPPILFSRCFTPGGTSTYQDWTKIAPGTPDTNCAMRVNFYYNGVQYTIAMTPEYPGTGTATVSCTQTSGGSCVAWTDEPTTGANANVAFLYAKGKKTDTLVGSYSMTFSMTVTHP